MANSLSNIIPIIYDAVDVVSRELTGFVSAVTLNATADQVAQGQSVAYDMTNALTARDATPAATPPEPNNDVDAGNNTMTIQKTRVVPFKFSGDETLGMGGNFDGLLKNLFAQAMRTLLNEVDADIAALYPHASRAYVPGSAPFSSDLSDSALVRKLLADNGAPLSELQLVIDTLAGANLRSLANLTHANEAGTDDVLRRGMLIELHGFQVRESANIGTHSGGTGSGYLVNGAHAEDVTAVALNIGSGTVLSGDLISFGDGNTYVVNSGISAPGTININQPGLMAALAGGEAATLGGDYTPNLAFARSAIHLLLRAPAMPEGGDAADDVTIIQDPVTGIAFQVALYRGYRQVMYEVGLAWGVKAVKPEHIVVLAG